MYFYLTIVCVCTFSFLRGIGRGFIICVTCWFDVWAYFLRIWRFWRSFLFLNLFTISKHFWFCSLVEEVVGVFDGPSSDVFLCLFFKKDSGTVVLFFSMAVELRCFNRRERDIASLISLSFFLPSFPPFPPFLREFHSMYFW